MIPSHVVVKPLSSKAKNRLVNIMEGNPICEVEQIKDDMFFLASSDRKYFFWVNVRTDKNWEVH